MSIDMGLLLVRVVLGLVVAAHGAQKLFGWFGGYGLRRDRELHGDDRAAARRAMGVPGAASRSSAVGSPWPSGFSARSGASA